MGFWDDVRPDEVPDDLGGNWVSEEGVYHVRVTHVDEDGGKDGSAMVVDMEVQAGTAVQQIGRMHRERFGHPSAANDPKQRELRVKQALKFAVAVGLTTEAEIAQAKAAGKIPPVVWRDAVGRHLGVKLKLDKKEKKYLNAGFDLWPLDAPEMKGCPINQAALEKRGDDGVDPFAGVGGDDIPF